METVIDKTGIDGSMKGRFVKQLQSEKSDVDIMDYLGVQRC